jgi:hypothetical protein
MVKGEEGREKGRTSSPNKGRTGFTLPPSLFPIKGTFEISFSQSSQANFGSLNTFTDATN